MKTDPSPYTMDTVERYFELLNSKPHLFHNHPEGGVRILTDAAEINSAQAETRAARLELGMDVSDVRVGVLAKDPYMTVVRDAVRFPDGSAGLYNRIIETSPVAILPLLDGRPVLMQVFRHGLRKWSLEFPRGSADAGESPQKAACREVAEEIGANILDIIPLGTFTPGGSSLSIIANLFVAHVDKLGASDPLEGIKDVRAYEVDEVEEKIASGELIDGFSMALFLRARLSGHI